MNNLNRGIIITSFGTTFEKTRKLCIEPVEDLARERYSDDLVLRAFTSRIVAKRLKDRGYIVKNPTEALEEMKKKEIKNIYIQPLLIIEGVEYEKTKKEIDKFMDANEDYNVKIGLPLLAEEKDYESVIDALQLEEYKSERALIFMGHGSYHEADRAYARLQDKFAKTKKDENIFVGTVEGAIGIEDIIGELKSRGIKKVELRPFMLVAGDHAVNDMASDEEDSWKTILEKEGFEVEATISGLGEIDRIREMFLEHLEDIL